MSAAPDPSIHRLPTANLVVLLQKIAKQVSYVPPEYRACVLREAARRLSDYRQAERGAVPS